MTAVARYIDSLQSHGGLKGTDIANFTDVSSATVHRWKAGTHMPHPSTQLLLRPPHAPEADGSFDVLYTAASRDGALAESGFHASKGQPILPSQVAKRLYQIEAALHRVLDLSGDGKLAALSFTTTKPSSSPQRDGPALMS